MPNKFYGFCLAFHLFFFTFVRFELYTHFRSCYFYNLLSSNKITIKHVSEVAKLYIDGNI